MRIGLDAREAFRENPRGIGLYARHLMREFADLCPEEEFVLYHEREQPTDLGEIPANMKGRRIDLPGGRWHSWERLAMPWRLGRDRLDVYHGTYNTLPPRWPLLSAPPMVVSLHDVIVTWLDDDLNDPYVTYCRKVTGRVVREAAAILTVSEWSKADIAERYRVDPAKIRVFYNGIHPDFLQSAPTEDVDRVRREQAGGRPYLFSIGSALRRKNTVRMVEALGRLHQRRPLEHRILISGLSEPQRGPVREAAARAGLGEHLHLLGYLPRPDLVALFAGADLSIYPSLAEGWGIPIVEALSQGTPVVTSDTTAMPEAGGDFATYFDPHDVEHMAQQIGAAIDGIDDFAPRAAAAVERARGFTWRRAAEVTLATYRGLAAR